MAESGIEVTNACLQDDKASSKGAHTDMVMTWLGNNYELKEGSCLPRCLLYSHYLEYCKRSCNMPLGAAIFGKLIRTKFPTLTTRRLGTRGQSKYHYYGLAVKVESVYTNSRDLVKGLTRFTSGKEDKSHEKSDKQCKQKVKTILIGFPRMAMKEINGKDFKQIDEINSFLVMYKAHCQRILDAVVAACFNDVKTFLMHFWCGVPDHVNEILKHERIPEVVVACDTIFYKKLTDILIPNSVLDIPESFRLELVKFTKSFLPWLDICLINVPKELAAAKMNVARTYIKLIQRQISFLVLAQPIKAILSESELSCEIIRDLEDTDLKEILGVSSFKRKAEKASEIFVRSFENYFSDIVNLLSRQASIGPYLSLLDTLIYDSIIKPAEQEDSECHVINTFVILKWSQVLTKIMGDLTLRNAETFGSIHLLTSMAMEYIFLAIESKMAELKELEIWKNIKSYTTTKVEDLQDHLCPSTSVDFEPPKKRPRIPQAQNIPLQRATISSVDIQHKGLNHYNKRVRSHSGNQYTSVIQYQRSDALEQQSGASQQESNNMMTEVAYLMREMPSLQDMVSNHTWNELQDSVYIPNHETGNSAFGHAYDFGVGHGLINSQAF